MFWHAGDLNTGAGAEISAPDQGREAQDHAAEVDADAEVLQEGRADDPVLERLVGLLDDEVPKAHGEAPDPDRHRIDPRPLDARPAEPVELFGENVFELFSPARGTPVEVIIVGSLPVSSRNG